MGESRSRYRELRYRSYLLRQCHTKKVPAPPHHRQESRREYLPKGLVGVGSEPL